MKDSDRPFVSVAVLILCAYFIRLGLTPLLGNRSPWLMFTAAIVVAVGRYGVRPGVFAMLLSFLLGMVAFVDNVRQSQAEAITSLIVFLVVGAAMLIFAARLKLTQQRAISLQAELHEAHTQSALGTMASIIAHELNQPLAAASNYVAASKRLLESEDGRSAGRVLHAIAEAETQIHRAGDIISHARDLVRNVSPKREAVSLRAMVNRVNDVLHVGGNFDKVTIRSEIEPDADELLADSIQIEQVLANLLRNACQASGPNSEILVKAASSDRWSIVEVRDGGAGIPEDRLSDLFTATRRSTHGGLGLGLSISRTIIEAHGGRIWAENRASGGASLFFTVHRAA